MLFSVYAYTFPFVYWHIDNTTVNILSENIYWRECRHVKVKGAITKGPIQKCVCVFSKQNKLFPTVNECHDKWDLIACYHALYLICALSSGHQSASIRSRQNGTQLSIGLCLKYRFQSAPVRIKTTDDKNNEVSAARAISKYVGVLLIVI